MGIKKPGVQDASTGGDIHTRRPKDLAIPKGSYTPDVLIVIGKREFSQYIIYKGVKKIPERCLKFHSLETPPVPYLSFF
ncbi:MAG: hypothetical protein L0213_07285 [Candidatus Dadabacteria bacterium]|nr:hypothetical protein [Candidatus Dadabacteria bacterium]